VKFLGGLVATLFVALPALAEVTLVGNVPNFEIAHLQEKIDQIWSYEKATYLFKPEAQSLVPPEIGFYPFERDLKDSEWKAWQKDWIRDNPAVWLDWTVINHMPAQALTSNWISEHIDTVFPFPSTFLAFHYDNTNRIQINPARTFLAFYVNDPYGIKRDTVGNGFYSAAHEMLHYILENDGIPGRLHHCLFISEKNGHSLMGDMTKYLIAQNISAPLIEKVGLMSEQGMMPCEQLSTEERAQVRKVMDESPLW